MGLAVGAARILLKEASRRPFTGKVLVLGKQCVYFSNNALQQLAAEHGVPLAKVAETASHKKDLADSGFISDECFLLSLGFSDYAALDISDYESADYIFDLNQPEPPPDLVEEFDAIIDSGTIEHVFHVPNALYNIFRMLKRTGRVIHLAPSSNYIDHGFYMFSPTLFWDFYVANNFEINNFQVIRHTINALTEPWEASDYRPGCLDPVSFGGLDDALYVVLCTATKTLQATGRNVPQQSACLRIWRDEPGEPPRDIEPAVDQREPGVYYDGFKDRIRRFPPLYWLLRVPFRLARSLKAHMPGNATIDEETARGLRLKVVDRY